MPEPELHDAITEPFPLLTTADIPKKFHERLGVRFAAMTLIGSLATSGLAWVAADAHAKSQVAEDLEEATLPEYSEQASLILSAELADGYVSEECTPGGELDLSISPIYTTYGLAFGTK